MNYMPPGAAYPQASYAGPVPPVSGVAAASGSPDARKTSPPFTAAFIYRAVLRWWKIATPLALVLGAAACAYVYLTHEPVYESRAWLRVQPNQYIISPEMRGSQATFVQTQAQIIKSPLVLEQVLSQPEIAEYVIELVGHKDPVSWIAYHMDVLARRDSELFVVGFNGPHPEQAAKITDAIVEAYFNRQAQDEALQMQKTIQLLEDERTRREQTIAGLRESIRELRLDIDPAFEARETAESAEELQLHDSLGNLTKKIVDLEVELEMKKASFAAYQEHFDKTSLEPNPEAIAEVVEQNADVVALRERLEAIHVRLEQIKAASTKGEASAHYVAMARAGAETAKELDELREKLRTETAEKRREARLRKHEEIVRNYQTAIAGDRGQLDVLKERYFQQIREGQDKRNEHLELAMQQAELRRERGVMQRITERTMRLRTEMRAPAQVTLLKGARVPYGPKNQLNMKKIFLFTFAGACIPFGLAVLWERVVCRVSNARELWQADLNVVGEVAKLPVSSRSTALATSAKVGREVSLFEESIDSLRTCLTLSGPGSETQVLVVTSSVSGEGKTSVAAQLAVSIARASGEVTLLIDADMRSPDLHNVFDIPNEPGLAQVLGRECTPDDAIVTNWSNYVHLLPAGTLKSSPHKLLGDGGLSGILDELRKKYKHIVIDTSPILSASESLVLAKSADGTLLCAMRDLSRLDQVQRAYDRLVNTGARPLGTVLNGVPTGRYAYLYGVYSYPRG